MPYADLNTIHDPATGTQAPASWGDQVRENFECGEYAIARTVLGSAASSISSGTLPTLSNAWCLKIFYRVQNSGGTAVNVGLRFNGDTGNNYRVQNMSGTNTTVAAAQNSAVSNIVIGSHGNESANRWASGSFYVMDYLGSGHKHLVGTSHDPGNGSTTQQIRQSGGTWDSTAAITSVTIIAASNNFVTGSSLTVVACNYV